MQLQIGYRFVGECAGRHFRNRPGTFLAEGPLSSPPQTQPVRGLGSESTLAPPVRRFLASAPQAHRQNVHLHPSAKQAHLEQTFELRTL